MSTITIRHGWRSRLRQVAAAFVTFAAGVVAATAGAPLAARVVAALVFLVGIYAVLDALVLASSWRLTASSLKVPTLASRKREIAGGSDLVVTPAGRTVGCLVVTGPRGTRYVNVNPLVSPSDLRAWFDAIGE